MKRKGHASACPDSFFIPTPYITAIRTYSNAPHRIRADARGTMEGLLHAPPWRAAACGTVEERRFSAA
jgi:hypothetical protein